MSEIDEETVERRVAKALYEAAPWGDGTTWATMPEAGELEFLKIARAAIAAMPSWRPIESAPKDGAPLLVKLKDRIPVDREDLRRWDGLTFVARNHGNAMHWFFAAPVGQGGFPDEWMDGWQPLPSPPKPEGGQT